MASIVLDDSTHRLTTGGVQWVYYSDPSKFGGADEWANVTDPPTKFGTFSISFQGTSIAFSGWVGPPHESQPSKFLVSIDGSPPHETSYQAGSIDVHQWYKTPLLPDKTHVLNVTRFPENIDIDYMVITAGRNTPLLGERLIVDDIDPALVYYGNWVFQDTSYQMFYQNDTMSLYPHGNSTHRTTSVGSGAAFQFTGTLVSVYGVFNWNPPCEMSIKYTIDDASAIIKNYTVVGTQFHEDQIQNVGHTLLYESDILPAGPHVLNFELTSISPNADGNDFSLAFDYILYSPSFRTLAELNASAPLPPITRNFSTSITPSAIPTIVPPTPSPSHDNHSKLIAEIAGGLAGGMALLALFLLVMIWRCCRTRRRQAKAKASLESKTAEEGMISPHPPRSIVSTAYSGYTSVAPFTLTSSPTTNTYLSQKNPPFSNLLPTSPSPHSLFSPTTSQGSSSFSDGTFVTGVQASSNSRPSHSRGSVQQGSASDFTPTGATRKLVLANDDGPPPDYHA